MQRRLLITSLSMGLFAGAVTTTALAAMSPLEQQLKDLESFQVIAHRGASGHAPESTMAAYELAREWDVDYLELDAQITADGEVVVFHDDAIDRTSDGEGAINDYTAAIDMPDIPASMKAMALYNRAVMHVAAGDRSKGMDDLDAVLAMDGAFVNVRSMAKHKLAMMKSRSNNAKQRKH